VEPFYFTPFGRKRLQTAHEAAGETLPNGGSRFFLKKKPGTCLREKSFDAQLSQ